MSTLFGENKKKRKKQKQKQKEKGKEAEKEKEKDSLCESWRDIQECTSRVDQARLYK